jgi:hypothetical protein
VWKKIHTTPKIVTFFNQFGMAAVYSYPATGFCLAVLVDTVPEHRGNCHITAVLLLMVMQATGDRVFIFDSFKK